MSNRLLALWENIRTPLGTSRLMRSVMELRSSTTHDWASFYGIGFPAVILGFLFVVWRFGKDWELDAWLCMTVSLLIVGCLIFSRVTTVHPEYLLTDFPDHSLKQEWYHPRSR